MRKSTTIYYLLFMVFCISCTPSENNSPEPIISEENFRNISELVGHDVASFHYENGLLVKALGNSGPDRDHFLMAIQVEYDSNKKVKRIIESNDVFPKAEGFNFNLTDNIPNEGSDWYIYEHYYTNNKLTSIKRNGELEQEFFYDENGRVSRYVWYNNYNNPHSTKEEVYTYNNEGKMVSYTALNSISGEIAYGNILTDNKINPFYGLWKKNGFIMPGTFSHLTDFNIPFEPHNVIKVYEGEEVDYNMYYEYDGNYPNLYDITTYRLDGPTYIKYLN
jgi:hypothetical protein